MIGRVLNSLGLARERVPSRCFISHSYNDKEACARLLATLPAGVEPVVFPPIVVPPDELVSTVLVSALLACEGLIYLATPISLRSFWVAFERDFALRARKIVYAFDAVAGRLQRVPRRSCGRGSARVGP